MKKYLFAILFSLVSMSLYAQTSPQSTTASSTSAMSKPTSLTTTKPTATTTSASSTTVTKPTTVTATPTSSTTAVQLGMRKYIPAEGVYAVEWQPGVDLPRASKREFVKKANDPDAFPTYALIVINGEYTVIFPGTLVLYGFGPYDIPTGIGQKSKYRPL